MSNIAVIGATGNIGGPLTQILVNRGFDVTAIARNPKPIEGASNLILKSADIFDFAQLEDAIGGHDAIVVTFSPNTNDYKGYFKLVEAAWRIKRAFKKVIPDAYFLNVGGASSLWTPDGFQMFEQPRWQHWFFNAGSPAHWARLYELSGFEGFGEMARQREAILADPSKDPYSDFTGPIIDEWYREMGEVFGKGMGGRAQLEYFECDLSFRWSFVSPPWLLGLQDVSNGYRTTIDKLPMENGQPAGIAIPDMALAIADAAEKQAFVHQHWSAARPLPEGVPG